jgi:hypothetical protein
LASGATIVLNALAIGVCETMAITAAAALTIGQGRLDVLAIKDRRQFANGAHMQIEEDVAHGFGRFRIVRHHMAREPQGEQIRQRRALNVQGFAGEQRHDRSNKRFRVARFVVRR